MPSIFNLFKHGIRRYAPNLFTTLKVSEPVDGHAATHIGAIGNTIQDSKHKGFMQLESGKSYTEGSNERSFGGTGGSIHYTTAYPNQNRSQNEVDLDRGIPMNEIHIRDDIDVDTLAGRGGVKRSIA